MKNKRYETCKLCKGWYSVGVLVKVPQVGYICPCCRAKAKYGRISVRTAEAGRCIA